MVPSIYKTLQFIKSHPIGMRDRIGAAKRWLKWQVGSRILRAPAVMPFVEETMLIVEPGMLGATGNIYVGLHEFEDMAFTLHFLRDSDLFLDIGANIGSYTILASGVASARTICCEPVPSTYQNLQRNLRINQLESLVQARCIAVSDQVGTLRFTDDLDTINHVAEEEYQGSTSEVQVETLDELIDSAARNTEAMMWKVDVEGHEDAVLAGASVTLRDKRLQAVLLEDNGPSVIQVMIEARFEQANYDPFERKLSPTKQSSGNNTLWIRDWEYCQTRLRESRKISVCGVTF